MSEGNSYKSHPVPVTHQYSLPVSHLHGAVNPGLPPQSPTQLLGYRNEIARDLEANNFNMNGVAGSPPPNNPQQPYPYHSTMPPTSRGHLPAGGSLQWSPASQWSPSYGNSTHLAGPDGELSRGSLPHDNSQANQRSYSQGEAWDKSRTSYVRSQDQNFAHPHNILGHTNYNVPPQSYTRTSRHTVEPSAAPSPPNQYPSSPRTPVSTYPSNNVPASQSFHPPSTRPSLPTSAAPLLSTLENRDRHIETLSTHVGGLPEPGKMSPPAHSPLSRQRGRGGIVPSLGSPANIGASVQHPERSSHRSSASYSTSHRPNDGYAYRSQGTAEGVGKGSGHNEGRVGRESADDEKHIKRERSRTASIDVSPMTARTDSANNRSPTSSRDSKSGIPEISTTKKRGMPVFKDHNGNEYYENEPVPDGVALLEGWQIGTGKSTKGLLLPTMKDGIPVNPEWGFTAGGKARQRLPQACKNCRAKKIKCVESDYDELVCQHCSKMRIRCQRYEKDDEKKKKVRKSSSQDNIKHEKGPRSASTASEKSAANSKMEAPTKNGSKKRKHMDAGPNENKKPNRGNRSRAGSMIREPLNTTLANAPAPLHPPAPLSAPARTDTKPALFPTMEEAQVALSAPVVNHGINSSMDHDAHLSRIKHVKELRVNRLIQSGQDSMLPDASPDSSFASASPQSSVVPLHSNGFVDGHGRSFSQTTDSRHSAMSSSTPTTFMGTPPPHVIPPLILGEDPRHGDLPNPAVLGLLVDAYFANVYSQTYAFLHRPTFLKNMENHSAVLLFSMCAVAARFSSYRNAEEHFAARARDLIMQNYDKYSLDVVQSMVHMGLHDFGSSNGHKAWMFAGMAVRMGAALNMNLENRKRDKEKSAVSKECARRTYWSYYLMDRFNSYGVARPFLTQDHDCHIQLPCNQPSFIDERYVITEHLLGPNPYYPDSGTSFMGAMAYLVRVVCIWGNILKQIHLSAFQVHFNQGGVGTKAENDDTDKGANEFNHFIDMLENWRKTLPTGLSYSNENLAGQIKVGTTGAFVMMHVMWHTAMAYVHRYVRTVGVPKEYIEENIPRKNIVESIRKAFVHADAVLQIMFHVQQQKQMAKERGDAPITVNAPFLGQAISDACNITVMRALEVRGEPNGAVEQRRRVKVGLDWLRELKRYWKPIEGMYRKLKKRCRNLEKSMFHQLGGGHMVPTPESSVDSTLQPGLQYPVDPSNYTADPTLTSGAMNSSVEALPLNPFPQFADFLGSGTLPNYYFADAFCGDPYALVNIAEAEGGFPDLYYGAFSETAISSVSAPFDNQIPVDPASMAMPELSTVQIEQASQAPYLVNDVSEPVDFQAVIQASDNEDEGEGTSPAADNAEEAKRDIHALYFDPTAVRDGNLQDSSSDTSGHSRRPSEAATKHESNPMDLLNLINTVDTASLESKPHQRDEFTGPKGAAAPTNNDMGGQPNLDNSGQN